MPDWRHEAACQESDPELFFPVGNGPPAEKQAREALGWCARCPVRVECRAWALAPGTRQDFGIWGGLTEDERAKIRRQEVRAASRSRRDQEGARA